MIKKFLYVGLLSTAFLVGSIKDWLNIKKPGTFIYTEQTTLWTETFGHETNPAILLIHGAGAHRKFWPDSFCKKLAAKNFFVIRFDLRDSGFSQRHSYGSSKNPTYLFTDMIDDIKAVLDFYGIKKAHIVGHSMGGCLVAGLMAYESDRLLSATIIGAGDIFTQEEHTALGLPERSQDLVKELQSYKPWGIHWFDKQILLKKMKLVHGSYDIDEKLFDEYTKEFYQILHEKPRIKNHAIMLFHTKPETLVKDLKKSPIPALILHGTQDALVPYDWGKAVSQQIRHAQFIPLESAGHMYCDQSLWDTILDSIVLFITQNQ